MVAVHTARQQDIVRFRADIAALAAMVRRCVQLGLASSPRSKRLTRLYSTLMAECDGQEALNALDEQIRKAGDRVIGVGPRNMKGKIGVVAMNSLYTEVRRLHVEREKEEREQEKVIGRRMKIEKELEDLRCDCQMRMCRKCLELLRQCEECEEASAAWEKMSTK
jgi:hypothetical protein